MFSNIVVMNGECEAGNRILTNVRENHVWIVQVQIYVFYSTLAVQKSKSATGIENLCKSRRIRISRILRQPADAIRI